MSRVEKIRERCENTIKIKERATGEITQNLLDIRYLLSEVDRLTKEVTAIAIESVEREKKLAKLEAEVKHWADAEKDGRLHITKVGIGGKLYEPNEYGDIYEWDVVSVGIGGCVGEDYLCDRDDSTDVQTFTYGDIGNGVYAPAKKRKKRRRNINDFRRRHLS